MRWLPVLVALAGCAVRDDGWWIDEQAGCVQHDRRVVEFHGGCGDAETLALSPDGTCWRFRTTCIPASFEPVSGDTDRCTYERFEELPPCE